MFHQKFSRLVTAFSLCPYNFVQPTIISTNASSKKYSINLRGIPSLAYSLLECLPALQHEYHDFPTLYLKEVALDGLDNILVFPIFPKSHDSFSDAACLLILYWAFSYSLKELQPLCVSESLWSTRKGKNNINSKSNENR